jgi:hypothetical protein
VKTIVGAALVQQPSRDNVDDSATDTKISLIKANVPTIVRDEKDSIMISHDSVVPITNSAFIATVQKRSINTKTNVTNSSLSTTCIVENDTNVQSKQQRQLTKNPTTKFIAFIQEQESRENELEG